MNRKEVEIVLAPPIPHFVGDGFRVHNFIPGGFRMDMKRMDPFILMDYNSKIVFPPTDKPKGVGVHPHRGFETVTIAYKGKVAHHDSSGGGGVIEEGDIQWMTAASGVLHKEYHDKEWSKTGGEFQMVQLWVNLPKKDKMSAPKYQAIKHDDLKFVVLKDEESKVEVIAGDYKGVKGSAATFSPINVYNVRLKANGSAKFQFPAHFTTVLLAVEGSFTINNEKEVNTDHLALMEKEGEYFEIEATEDALILLLSGEPLNEPIVAQGPFVMNSKEEIITAINDYNAGKFGHLED